MLRARSELLERGQMRGRRIAFVPVESVIGIARMQLEHVSITAYFCQNRCCHDRWFARITTDDSGSTAGQVNRNFVAINQCVLGGNRQAAERAAHTQHRGLENIDLINDIGFDENYVPRQGVLLNKREQAFARELTQYLGISQPTDGFFWVKDDCCAYDRAGEWTTPGFVNAGDVLRLH